MIYNYIFVFTSKLRWKRFSFVSSWQKCSILLLITGDSFDSAITSLDSYFIPKKSLIYDCYFLSARQNSTEIIVTYITYLQILAKSCGYGGFEEEIIRNQVEMSFVSFVLAPTKGKKILLLNSSKQFTNNEIITSPVAKSGKLPSTRWQY